MCAIVGFLDKTNNTHADVAGVLCEMYKALGWQGRDSAGVALYESGHAGALVLQIKLGEHGDLEARSQEISPRVHRLRTLRDRTRTAVYLCGSSCPGPDRLHRGGYSSTRAERDPRWPWRAQ